MDKKSKSLPRPHTAKNPSKQHRNLDQIACNLVDNEKNENIEGMNINLNNFANKTLYSKIMK